MQLRASAGPVEIVGHPLPSPEAVRSLLDQFHDEGKIAEAKRAVASGMERPTPPAGARRCPVRARTRRLLSGLEFFHA